MLGFFLLIVLEKMIFTVGGPFLKNFGSWFPSQSQIKAPQSPSPLLCLNLPTKDESKSDCEF